MTTWIFQGNPKRFKVDDYLRKNQNIIWGVRQEHYVDDIQVGDTVYIWRSEAGKKGTGGVIARAIVTGEPFLSTIPSEYWVNPSDANEVLPRVPLEVKELQLDGEFLSRQKLLNDNELKNLTIIKMSNSTNFVLTEQHSKKLTELWLNLISSNALEKKEIPIPEPVERSREYFLHNEEKRNEVIYDFLFVGNSHRWLDENILKLDSEISRGYQSMGILHHLGLKNNFKGKFRGLNVAEAIQLLEQERKLNPQNKDLYVPLISSLLGTQNIQLISDNQIKNVEGQFFLEEGKEYPEGKIAYVLHRKIERNPHVIKDAKTLFLEKNGRLFCEACKFDFTKIYGDRGNHFIEGHHKKLVSEMKEGQATKVEDIAMLCSNCHRMIHRKPLVSVEELANEIMAKEKFIQ